MTEISGVGLPRVAVPGAPIKPAGAPAEAPPLPVAIPDLPELKLNPDNGEVITPRDWAETPASADLDGVKLDPEMLKTLDAFARGQVEMKAYEAEVDRLWAQIQGKPAGTGPLRGTGPVAIPPNPAQVERQAALDRQVDAALAAFYAPEGQTPPPGNPPPGPLPITDPLILGADAALTSREARGTPRWTKAVSYLMRARQLLGFRKDKLTGRLAALKLHFQPLTMAIGFAREALARATDPKDIRRISEKLKGLMAESAKLNSDVGEATADLSACDLVLRDVAQSLSEMGCA